MSREAYPNQLDIYQELAPPPAWSKIVLPGGRVVWSPSESIAVEQDAILHEAECLGVHFEHATAVRGSDFVQNAVRHTGNRHFFTLDFKSAYSQVDIAALARKLCNYGFHDPMSDVQEVYSLLQTTCTPPEGTGLVQGGSSSPLLFNLYCLDLDAELGAYCAEQGITYTRYLDDLTFSSPDVGYATHARIGKGKRQAIRKIIASHSMELNEAKTRVRDLQKGPVIVTGVQINTRGKVQMPASYLRQKRHELRNLLMSATDVREVVNYAAGLNGLLQQTSDRTQSDEEKMLYLDVQDVLMTYGSGL